MNDFKEKRQSLKENGFVSQYTHFSLGEKNVTSFQEEDFKKSLIMEREEPDGILRITFKIIEKENSFKMKIEKQNPGFLLTLCNLEFTFEKDKSKELLSLLEIITVNE